MELAALGCVCGGFFLRTEARAADVSLVACMLQVLRLSRRRRVPVRARSIAGDGGEEAVAVIEDARVAVAAAVVVLAWAAQGLAEDIWRHGSALTPRFAAITANQCARPEGNGAAMQQANVPKQMPKQGDEVRQSGYSGSSSSVWLLSMILLPGSITETLQTKQQEQQPRYSEEEQLSRFTRESYACS